MKVDQWKEFSINDLFQCTKTKSVNANKAAAGMIPYVTRSAMNNGVTGLIDCNRDFINKGGCITIGGEGIVAFYQENDFVTGVNITALRNRHLNQYNALFICTVLNQNKYKYSYGRPRSVYQIKKEKILLPSENNEPDWGYMERYIKSLRHKPISTRNAYHKFPISNVATWKEFPLDQLFDFVKGRRLRKEDMLEGSTNYLGAISENNGVRQLIDAPAIFKGNCITVNYNGSVGEAFYQFVPFWATDDINVLYAKGWELNKYIALFLTTIIKANRYKFSYGRKWTMEKMKKSPVRLPVTSQGVPDWKYMENYIRSLPYADRI